MQITHLSVALALLAILAPARGDEPPRVLFPAPLAVVPGGETRILLRGRGIDRLTEVTSPAHDG